MAKSGRREQDSNLPKIESTISLRVSYSCSQVRPLEGLESLVFLLGHGQDWLSWSDRIGIYI